ncbi:MAG: class I SAM-dependent methyltransferase [Promethearchaeota archaeon]
MRSREQYKTKKIRDFYNKGAEFYNARYQSIQFIKYSLLLPKLMKFSKEGIGLNLQEPILDFGGGGGLLIKFIKMFHEFSKIPSTELEKILEKYKPEQILLFERMRNIIQTGHKGGIAGFKIPAMVICDISVEMLLQCKDIINKKIYLEIHEKILGIVACNCEFLPFRNNIFPTITAFTVIQNLNDIEFGLKEIKRVSIPSDEIRIGISVLKKIYKKMEFVKKLIPHFENIESILIGEKLINEFKEIKRYLEKRFGIYLDNGMIKNIKNIEDHFFFM